MIQNDIKIVYFGRLGGLGKKWLKMASDSSILATWVAWARNGSKWYQNREFSPVDQLVPEMAQNGFEIKHFRQLPGLCQKLFKIAPKS